jgi:uncharacterized SAM-binding protein YcdF (DUF218 family)
MGSTGTPALDSLLAAAFAGLVLCGRPTGARAAVAHRAAAAAVGLAVASRCAVALSRHLAALRAGDLHASGVAPPATLVALLLVVPWTVRAARGGDGARAPRPAWRRVASTAVAGLALVLAQVEAVGATDYRARADAVVVLGARVHADGTPSGALADRVRTACTLWRDGLAPVLVLSGGRDRDAVASEPEAMRAVARAQGVPDAALVLDEGGVDTAATVRFAAALARDRGWRRVLVVSHDYHLARVRLLADREGLAVRTVPATESAAASWKHAARAREVRAYHAAWAGR